MNNLPENQRPADESKSQRQSNGRESRPSAIGRDELNLVDFPIGVLRYQQPVDSDGRRLEELVFSVDAFEEHVGSVVPKKVTIRTSSRHGFPTPKEDELLIGLMLLCRLENNFTEPSVQFRISDLLRLLGWADNGRSRRQLRDGLDRLAGVKLKFENSWKSSEGREYEREFVTGLLDSYDLNSVKDGDAPGTREVTKIQWSAEFYADIRRGNVRELDTAEYFALKLPLSRRLYRFLDKHLEASKQFEMNLKTFAAHLGISESQHIGKIRERLKRPIRELEERGTLIQPQTDTERYHRLGAGNWLIRFERIGATSSDSRQQSPLKASPSSRSQKPQGTPEAKETVRSFYELWCDNADHRPSVNELRQANEFLQQYGHVALRQLLPEVVKLMRERFPDATSFGATRNYWAIAHRKISKRTQQAVEKEFRVKAERAEEARHEESRQQNQELRRLWNELGDSEQAAIRRQVLQNCDEFVRQKIESRQFSDPLVMVACIQQLRKQRQQDAVSESNHP